MAFRDWFGGARAVALKKESAPVQRERNVSQQIRTAWDGAKVDNLVSGWLTTSTPINAQLESELRSLRARSRQLAKNDPYVKRFLSLARRNTVGSTGFVLRPGANRANGNPDKAARAAISSAWGRAMQPGAICSKGKYSGIDMFNLCSDQLSRDGEVIILQNVGGEFGVTFAFIDPELLDVNHKDTLKNGNTVRMGLETNDDGRVIAYHFHSTDSTNKSYYISGGNGYIRIDAGRVIHAFVTEYVDQLRGYPHTAAAMLRLRMLNGYEEAELVGARGGAAMMGFVVRGEDGGAFEGDQTIVDSDNAELIDGNASGVTDDVIDADSGSFHYLENGATVQTFDPQHPNGAYQQFIKAVLRGIAAGLDVSYNTLANDLEGVNFSSIRTGVLEDREAWKARQVFLIQHIVTPMFQRWLEVALLNRAVTLPRGLALPSAGLDRFLEHTFQGRRWAWVDPAKDGAAHTNAVNERFRSRSDIIREMGDDPEQVFAEIAAENELLEELGIKPAAATPPTNEPEPDEPDDQVDDDVEDDKKPTGEDE